MRTIPLNLYYKSMNLDYILPDIDTNYDVLLINCLATHFNYSQNSKKRDGKSISD